MIAPEMDMDRYAEAIQEAKRLSPEPAFARENWIDLCGAWEFAFEEDRAGNERICTEFPRMIQVPFAYQTKRSGINRTERHDILWYRKVFSLPENFAGNRVWLCFQAVDYHAEVWVNGQMLGTHDGGYLPFRFELPPYLQEVNEIVVKAVDLPDTTQPRGKQYWKETPDRCWYTPTSGIWQKVWLQAIPGSAIESIQITPDIETNSITMQTTIPEYQSGDSLQITICYKGSVVKQMTVSADAVRSTYRIALLPEDSIDEMHYWSVDRPNLYDVCVSLFRNDELQDRVDTYFGMRKVEVCDGRICLNHDPLYQKLILDQGYWKDSGLTAPDSEAFIRDIQLAKAMGFNGARKHQKIEDPAFYYWADHLGFLVWGEIPSAYEFCSQEINNITETFLRFVERDYNHPSIITWVPLNESWGVRKIAADPMQQAFARSLYELGKALDPIRLISTNDGWENVKADIVSIHDYHTFGEDFTSKYTEDAMKHPEDLYPGGRRLFARGESYRPGKTAFMVTEYGGIALAKDTGNSNWGYGESETSTDALLSRYRDVTDAIRKLPGVCGFCYTQLTDVYQEVNGLLTMDHEPKVAPEELKKINN